jgi:protein-S-isoprenylcysteine O-methyltransferase Ste14
MAGLALALYLGYLLLAFGVRGAIQWRRTGDVGFRFGADRAGSPQWWARLAFVAALAGGALAPVLALVGWHEPIPALGHGLVALAGTGLALTGIIATFVAQVAMGTAWRVGVDPEERTEHVERWPFTLVSNPNFTAMAVTATGFVLMVPSLLALAAFGVLLWDLRYQVVVVEEPYLHRLHGAQYAAYAARVGRFVPGIGLEP